MIGVRGRAAVSAADRRRIIHDISREEIRLSGGADIEVLYRIGNGQWTGATLTPEDGIPVSAQHNPLGGTVEIRIIDIDNGGFSSAPFRVRLARAGRAPRIRVTGNANNPSSQRLTGLNDRMSWSAGPTGSGGTFRDEDWNTVDWKGVVPAAELRDRFGAGLQQSADGAFVELWVRLNPATARNSTEIRTPASPPIIFMIPANMWNASQ
jgi:hypothetical protein